MSFSCRIVTPSAAAFSGSVEEIRKHRPTMDNRVADGRAPLLVKLGTGLLRLDTEGDAQWFAVHGGFAQVGAEGLVVLAEQCEAPSKLILKRRDKLWPRKPTPRCKNSGSNRGSRSRPASLANTH